MEFRTRHLSVISITALAVGAMITDTPLENLQIVLAAVSAIGGADWIAARVKPSASAPKTH